MTSAFFLNLVSAVNITIVFLLTDSLCGGAISSLAQGDQIAKSADSGSVPLDSQNGDKALLYSAAF